MPHVDDCLTSAGNSWKGGNISVLLQWPRPVSASANACLQEPLQGSGHEDLRPSAHSWLLTLGNKCPPSRTVCLTRNHWAQESSSISGGERERKDLQKWLKKTARVGRRRKARGRMLGVREGKWVSRIREWPRSTSNEKNTEHNHLVWPSLELPRTVSGKLQRERRPAHNQLTE